MAVSMSVARVGWGRGLSAWSRVAGVGSVGYVSRCGLSGEIASGGLGRSWEDKEHAQEAVYFQKEERELLKKMAKKMGATPEQKAADAKQIKEICEKHGVPVSSAFVDDLIHFKYAH
ncbi:hypothetical protein FVE85_9512 [Porphyridium purpureum]|uniref:Uncharacterized protein n=1 Tax=Porphyridium purpureum TaxID=35688 RepID=A0A5J4YL92_PORPP|nr:hypothetical protein FVE85_9512 [Porphyridium purpureum]|eukprot:POR1787..scf261_15